MRFVRSARPIDLAHITCGDLSEGGAGRLRWVERGMSNSSDSSSPVASSHVSLCGEGEEGAVEDDGWALGGQEGARLEVFEEHLKVLEPSDRVRELQTILRDR